jgi:hypothetical protein
MRMKKILAMVATLLLASTSLGASSVYQVELLVYAHLTPGGIASEHWPALVGHNDAQPRNAITLQPVSSAPLNAYPTLTYLPSHAWHLTKDGQRIENNLKGKILYHQAWRVSRSMLTEKTRLFVIQTLSESSMNNLTGTFSIRLARYFDTDLRLTIQEPTRTIRPYLSEQSNPCWHGDSCYFSLNMQRRTRSETLNYLDHPLYGILLEITPVSSGILS